MGLLDSLAGAAGQLLGQQQGNNSPLLQAALSMLNNGSAQGGLQGLVQQFTQAGLGQQIQSWIGNGANLPISADQVKQALGNAHLDSLAQASGLNTSDVATHLSSLLPGLIDKLTPNGQVPSGGVENALEALGGFLKH